MTLSSIVLENNLIMMKIRKKKREHTREIKKWKKEGQKMKRREKVKEKRRMKEENK